MTRVMSQSFQLWRAVLGARAPRPPERGLGRVWIGLAGGVERCRRRAGKYLASAAEVARRGDEWRALTAGELAERSDRLRRLWRSDAVDESARIESLALVREQARRELGLEPFAVQIAGAAALLDGCVIEMATGEGKTLVAALAAALMGWRGRGCHVVTVNDYLVERDAAWMGPLYRACGASVGFLTEASPSADRRLAYAADVTYATNKELAADFLRDRIVLQAQRDSTSVLLDAISDLPFSAGDRLLQRGLECAIVDEADSILIDEAVTPLIISGATENVAATETARQAATISEALAENEHYRLDRRFHEVRLTQQGRDLVRARSADLGGVWGGRRRAEELIVQSLIAREFHLRDRQYVVSNGRVVIVDEFTGRLMPDRAWRSGLHQAVEAKEGLEVRAMQDTLARVSFQRFFRSYRSLCGMTGTARESRGELWSPYGLPVVTIPTNRPCVRIKCRLRTLSRSDDRWSAVLNEIEEVHLTDRPVLIGTRTVERSERLSDGLRARGIDHRVLNAVRHEQEAGIVARAGEAGAVTIATNMAGRGTDIRLGAGVAARGGLHVIVAEPNESRRIDRQFIGRGARQGDPGSSRLFVSLDDELIVRQAPWLARMIGVTGGSRWMTILVLGLARARAGALARRRRRGVMRADEWLDQGLGFAGSGRV